MLRKSEFQGNPSWLKFIKTDLSQQTLQRVFKYHSLEQQSVLSYAWGWLLLGDIMRARKRQRKIQPHTHTHRKKDEMLLSIQNQSSESGCCFQIRLSGSGQTQSDRGLFCPSAAAVVLRRGCWPRTGWLGSCLPTGENFSRASPCRFRDLAAGAFM